MRSISVDVEPRLKSLSYKQLLQNRNYRLLLSAQFVSDFGDGVYELALIWAMKVLTGSAVQMSFLLAAQIVPLILLGIFAGVIVDNGNKKQIMIIADLFRGLVVAVLAILYWFDSLKPWMLIIGAVILSSFSAFFSPARIVAVRTIVPEEYILKAQSLSSVIQTIVGLASPALAALLLSIDFTFAFLFNSASFIVSLVCILFIKHEILSKVTNDRINFKSIKDNLVNGYKLIFSIPLIRGLLVYLVLVNFMFAPISILFPVYVDSASELAILEIAFFVGIMVGSVLVGYFSRFSKIVPVIIGLLLVFVSFGILAFVNNFFLAVTLIFTAGIGSPIVNVTLQSVFIVKVPKEVLGRAASSLKVLLELAKPLSLLMTGSMLISFSVRDLFLSIAMFGMIIVLLMFFNPTVRNIETDTYKL